MSGISSPTAAKKDVLLCFSFTPSHPFCSHFCFVCTSPPGKRREFDRPSAHLALGKGSHGAAPAAISFPLCLDCKSFNGLGMPPLHASPNTMPHRSWPEHKGLNTIKAFLRSLDACFFPLLFSFSFFFS